MMQIMALRVLRELADDIQDINFYLIMCDEATDVKNVSELAVCLRWVDDELEAHDESIGLKNMPNTDADSTVRELKDVLLRMHLKLNKCRGQRYDKCSTMSGSKSGVPVQIKREEERALYTHCYTHSINLLVGYTMKVCPVLIGTIDNTYELTKLIKMSPKRDATLHSIQAENNSSGSNEDGGFVDGLKNPTIKLFCHTRWNVHVNFLSGVMRNFDEFQKLWIGRLKTVPVRR